ncbi:MAG: FkbM family methyltransferase [Cyanobacteria bacterium HKST-UBA04]|nr:FkbM family methyltransferase [Cyanobacteria bacterium HKST-UBA04]MCA9842364.1 FkbM family methyltransferase [Cyanobacteria bacterium HKST-UBA03]
MSIESPTRPVPHPQADTMPVTQKAFGFCRPLLHHAPSPLSALVVQLMGLAGWVSRPVNHRLYWRFCRFLGQVLSAVSGSKTADLCDVRLSPDCVMTLQLTDPYWSRVASSGYDYEPELYSVFARLSTEPFTFIDCGANYGYWSILLSSQAFGAHPTLAVEASPDTVRWLRRNAGLNGDRFGIVHQAIASQSGQWVVMDAASGHAGAHIVSAQPDQAGATQEGVTTITLDEVFTHCLPQHFGSDTLPERVVVKLDVEGQEIPALKGATALFERDMLLVYEDHGKDVRHEVTRFILEELGLNVYYAHPDGRLEPITDLKALDRIKTRLTVGYNFMACRSGTHFDVLLQQG